MYGNTVNTRPTERQDGFLTPTRYARTRPTEMGGRHSATGGRQNVGRGGGRGRGFIQGGGRGRGTNDNLYAALDDTNLITPLHQRKLMESTLSDADTPTIRNGNGHDNDTATQSATQLTSVQEAAPTGDDSTTTKTDDQTSSLPSTTTTRSKRSRKSTRKRGDQWATLSPMGTKIMTELLTTPIHRDITTDTIQQASMKEGMDILLSIAARRAYQHTGFSTDKCAPQWQWKSARDLLSICNNPENAAAACSEAMASTSPLKATNMSPSDVQQLVGTTKFQSMVAATPPNRKGMRSILKKYLARMYPMDFDFLFEDMKGLDEKMLHRLLTVPGAIHNYCAIAQYKADFSPPMLCNIEHCLPLEFDPRTKLPIHPRKVMALSASEVRELVQASKKPLVTAFDEIVRMYQPAHHHQIMLQVKQLTVGHLTSLAIEEGRLAQWVADKHILPPPTPSIPEEAYNPPQEATTSMGSTTPHSKRSHSNTRQPVSHDMLYRLQISTHGDKENSTRPAHQIAMMYLQNLYEIISSVDHHLIIHPTEDHTTLCISSVNDLPTTADTWAPYLGTVRTSIRQDGVSFEVLLRSEMSLPHLLRTGYFEFDDETAEHIAFLQCKRMRVELVSQHRHGFIPVMMAVNSSANDGPARVKTEIIQRAADLNHKLKYAEFDVAWYTPTGKHAVPSLVILTHPDLAGHIRAVVAHLGVDAKRGRYPATYDYVFEAAREEDHISPGSHQASLLKQKQFLINRRFIVLEGIHPEINLDQIIPPIDYEWADDQRDPNCLSVAQLLIQHPRLFRAPGSTEYLPSPFTKVQRSLTENKWYLQTTGADLSRAQQIASDELPSILKSWLNHWETANMCIRTGISTEKLYSTSPHTEHQLDCTHSEASIQSLRHAIDAQKSMMSSQQAQLSTLLALITEQQTTIRDMSKTIQTQSEQGKHAHAQTSDSLQNISTSLHHITIADNAEKVSSATNSTTISSFQESADRFKAMLDNHSVTSSLTEYDQSTVNHFTTKLEAMGIRLMELPTTEDLHAIGEWMRLTMGCCNKTQVAVQQSRQMIKDGREDIQQFCETVRVDEMEHLSHILSSINAFLQAAQAMERQTQVPMDTACTTIPPPTIASSLTTPTKRIMDLQQVLMDRLDTATQEMAQINADHTRREAYLARCSQLLPDDPSCGSCEEHGDETASAETDQPLEDITADPLMTTTTTAALPTNETTHSPTSSPQTATTTTDPDGTTPNGATHLDLDSPNPPDDDPSQAPIPKQVTGGPTWTSMDDDVSEPDVHAAEQRHPGDAIDHNVHQHGSPSKVNDKQFDQVATDTIRTPDQTEVKDTTQSEQCEQQRNTDTNITHSSLQHHDACDTKPAGSITLNTPEASVESADLPPPSPIGRVMHQHTNGFQARVERSKAATSMATELRHITEMPVKATSAGVEHDVQASMAPDDTSPARQVIENMDAVETTAQANLPPCLPSASANQPTRPPPQYQDLDVESEDNSSGLPSAGLLPGSICSSKSTASPPTPHVVTRRRAKAANTPLFPALTSANPKTKSNQANSSSTPLPKGAGKSSTTDPNSSIASGGNKN